MKILLTVLLISISLFSALADVHVKGYTRKDGTYVAPHVRSSPNSTNADNWSTKGNVNPYTGKAGTKNATASGLAPSGIAETATSGVVSSSVSDSGSQRSQSAPVFLLAAAASAVATAIPAAPNNEELTAAASLSEKELMLKIYAKILTLEERVTAGENAQDKKISGLRIEIQASLNAIGEEFGRLKAVHSQVQPQSQSDTATQNAGLIATDGGAPSMAQWRQISDMQSYATVEKILGKPSKISNSGSGERWQYRGGGYVEFYSVGTVYRFGGYSSGN